MRLKINREFRFMGLSRSLVALSMCLLGTVSWAGSEPEAEPLRSAAQWGLMQGFPPAQDKRVTPENFMVYPWSRWAFQHVREIHPSREVYRGRAAPSELASEPLALDGMKFTVSDGRSLDLDTWLQESAADSFLVLHRGRVVYERYLNSQQPHTQHQMFSATKSFIGTLVLSLAEEGSIDLSRTMVSYVPELKGSAFAEATVQQVLDMTTSITFNEDYTDPQADIWKYGYVFGIGGKAPADYHGPRTIYEFLPGVKRGSGAHGKAFHYVTPNTDALGWVLSRVSGKSITALLQERIWQRLGVERDGYFWLDPGTTEMAGGGLNITARDAARFGQMILQKGRYNGEQILPGAIAERILQPGNPDTFTRFHKDPWYTHVGYAYHDQWWTFNNAHKAVSAIGVHGQFIYIDPVAEMVIVKQSSHPDAEGESNEVDGPLIWQAIAEHLMSLGER